MHASELFINLFSVSNFQKIKNGLKVVIDSSLVSSIDFQADLVILFTKAMQLDGMMQSIQNMVGEETKVLCLLNGIEH
ncbi:MAG TPA: 2-dehydropantoate 2-reductase, partial [Candidatus Enterococcus avicola]|nr:2-dehydropantoate 2-reductase [Candidatus Enterococcus avicola]